MPPVSKKLLAKVARAVKSAGVPRLARKIFGRAPDVFQACIRLVAQRLERRGQPHRRQRIELEFGFAIGRQARPAWRRAPRPRPRAGSEIRWRRSARPSLGDIGFARGAGRGDLALDQVLLERGEYAAGLFDLLKQRPCGFAKLLRQRLDAAGAGCGIATPWRGWILPAAPVACCARRAARTDRAVPAPACAAAR